ncbi:MAG: hypothetical protein A2504_09465 [Bdellovibrionales bacterium RIFOXYD12_FULL_39_22]|nr:MAG: hypothetical protein A2385_12955 [Bdellovibrionales bacterium RIFOXYB1_FULL_39_21]OFZ40954.1 MAG: hypothetical protein A2485_16465 [Bdellovibrionales bacterium RIFOXYC12_FULL_39_17]OFZ44782.1 MAG: hypothetical protein A2404_09755 [Bdellovibrionales bacterium RIFOXYC1_FULL_39_130]OFZ70128.1 MAG: hypothetical protein A2451_03865 [Bdellovibrionales bacterium RIFOXYC2_FULL_39_8]OFZ74247.1 MAG: hypothetical protein A2560_16720 [Bdellovibrionales bacterium RIFOXYD1_FULL_39_84]OFZ92111.1 MAG:
MRPKKHRHTCCKINANYFKPRGVSMDKLSEIVLHADEIEALRLAHLNDMYQEEAAVEMKISRQTFGRILNSAYRKITEAIIDGKALRLDESTDLKKSAT